MHQIHVQATQTISPSRPQGDYAMEAKGEICDGMLKVCFSLVFCLFSETGSVHSLFIMVKYGLRVL